MVLAIWVCVNVSSVFVFFRQHQFAIRATLLSSETLKSRNIYLDAAMQFMRMTAEVK